MTDHCATDDCRKARSPGAFALLPWLLLGMGAFSNLFQDRTAHPLIGGLGLLAFNSLYIYVAVRAFVKETRESVSTRLALALLGALTCALAIGYGGTWLLFFPLLGLATGAALRGETLRWTALGLGLFAGAVSVAHDGWAGLGITYATLVSTAVTGALLSLADTVKELRAAREELALRAVEQERLRFSRDLHDLLGHTLSVIVVKSEAARRLAPRDVNAALAQLADIESVGRQALTEIREAVTGYRKGSLTTELDRASSALAAAGVTPVVQRSGPPLDASAETLLGWVVREATTNVIRHSSADHCTITVSGTGDQVRVTVADDGPGVRGRVRVPEVGDGPEVRGQARTTGGDDRPSPPDQALAATAANHTPGTPNERQPTPFGSGPDGTPTGSPDLAGTGLRGLTERLAAAGGRLTSGPAPDGGFLVTAELPVTEPLLPAANAPTLGL
ncbi:two-component system sensor histidine kinase DesK [Streptomyces sp. SAI-170]|uniref:sensor histidine kinase n=1 Tax=Streptomyces sp. SAI-170 TaxID=3377729 RepID=UPI003C7A9827